MSERTREPEFYANATLGFRQWYSSLGDGENGSILLEGLDKYDFYQPRRLWDSKGINRAECLRLKLHPESLFEEHGEVPRAECSCGFHAHGRREGSGIETTVHMVGGVVAGWGNLELHERGFKCEFAKVLAFFAPDSRKSYADYDGVRLKKWAALMEMCEDNAIPVLGRML